jgi:hypothetical protein
MIEARQAAGWLSSRGCWCPGVITSSCGSRAHIQLRRFRHESIIPRRWRQTVVVVVPARVLAGLSLGLLLWPGGLRERCGAGKGVIGGNGEAVRMKEEECTNDGYLWCFLFRARGQAENRMVQSVRGTKGWVYVLSLGPLFHRRQSLHRALLV